MHQQILMPRCTVIGEPSATKADSGCADKVSANGAP
jgi:hypothetical protein